MWDSQQEEVSLHDLLKDEFFYLLDTTRYTIDERSYIHDTSTLAIVSFVIIHPVDKGANINLRMVGFSDDFKDRIDTTKTPKSELYTHINYPKDLFYSNPEKTLPGYVTVIVPINNDIARRSLMKGIKLSFSDTRVIFADTLTNSFYFYKRRSYKPSIF